MSQWIDWRGVRVAIQLTTPVILVLTMKHAYLLACILVVLTCADSLETQRTGNGDELHLNGVDFHA